MRHRSPAHEHNIAHTFGDIKLCVSLGEVIAFYNRLVVSAEHLRGTVIL